MKPDAPRETIGFDIGGSRVKAVRARARGAACTIIGSHTMALAAEDRSEAGLVELIARIARELEGDGEPPVGVSVAGFVREETGVVSSSPNFAGWSEFAVGARMSAAIGRTVVVDNDANANLIAEARVGAAVGCSNVLMLTLGTGIGGALMLDGRLRRGARGMAGEAGHTVLVRGGFPCGCGRRGCAEQYASTQFLRRAARACGMRSVAEAPRAEAGECVATLARKGDQRAQAIWDAFGRHLASLLADLLHVLDVDHVVLGGGLAAAFDLFESTLWQALRIQTHPSIVGSLTLQPARVGALAGALGAAILALEPME